MFSTNLVENLYDDNQNGAAVAKQKNFKKKASYVSFHAGRMSLSLF